MHFSETHEGKWVYHGDVKFDYKNERRILIFEMRIMIRAL